MTDDPFDHLSRLRYRDRRLETGEDPGADALLARIVSSDPWPQRRTSRRLRWPAAAGAALLFVGSAGAAAWWAARPSDSTTVTCFSQPSLTPTIQVGVPRDPELTPAQQCEPLWADGTLGDGALPPLTSCITRAGIVAVIPGDVDVCDTLGLVPASPMNGGDSGDVDVAAQVAALISERWPRDCVASTDEARAVVDAVFGAAGAVGWSVTVAADVTGDRPCLFAAVDAEQRTVLVVAASAPP